MNEINVDKLREQSSSRRNTQITETPLWQCHYCRKSFIHEASFMKHRCKQMYRQEQIKSQIGQAAYAYYADWMKLRKYKAPSIDAFTTSRYFTSFYKFAEHVKKIKLGAPEIFMRLMVERDLSPTIWVRSQCYSIYLDYYDNGLNPMDHVIYSIETLLKISENENIELSKIFTHLGTARITELISLRKVSPWLMLCSKSFGTFLKSLPELELEIFLETLNSSYWVKKLDESGDFVKEIVTISQEIGL